MNKPRVWSALRVPNWIQTKERFDAILTDNMLTFWIKMLLQLWSTFTHPKEEEECSHRSCTDGVLSEPVPY